jgi:hypothetical protein
MILEQLPEAEQEIDEAVDYYERKQDGLGLDFLSKVQDAYHHILASPTRWPLISKRVRRYLLDQFPYGVIYEVRNDLVLVIAVMHLKRRPGYWRRRRR